MGINPLIAGEEKLPLFSFKSKAPDIIKVIQSDIKVRF
jgi:hypothetical protein